MIPATTDHFLVQNVFGFASGLPRDVAVNNFVFKNTNEAGPAQTVSAEERCKNAVRAFYRENAPALAGKATTFTSVLQLLSAQIVSWKIKVYDLGRPPYERVPTVFDLSAVADLTGMVGAMPPEVSAVLSLQTPIIGRRGRGRIFLGPLGTNATAVQDGTPHIAVGARNRIIASAALLAVGNGQDVEWQVWSGARQRMARVVGGWVDDAYDIQNRRGTAPSTRSTFGNITPTESPAVV